MKTTELEGSKYSKPYISFCSSCVVAKRSSHCISRKQIEEVLGIQHSPVTVEAVKGVGLLERDGEDQTQANLRHTQRGKSR